MAVCEVCFRHCELKEGQTGFCGARICRDGAVTAGNYGRITSLALDPVEKKPFARFMPGSLVLSVGSYGCNLRCPFCQNSSISWSAEALALAAKESDSGPVETITPEELTALAVQYVPRGNIGVAFTYNEPLVGWEFVRDTAKLVHEAGLRNILVTNGTASLSVLAELAPYIDAMNIDLKGFTDHYYRDVLQGDRGMVMAFIREAAKICHVELTTLIVPGENDTPEEMEELSGWIAGLTDVYGGMDGREIPLHISRFFPRFHMTDRAAADVGLIYRLADLAGQRLRYVYTGNC